MYIMNADGSGQVRVTATTPWGSDYTEFAEDPSWSPDATKLAFSVFDTHCGDGGIYSVDIGSGAANFLACGEPDALDTGNFRHTAWAPQAPAGVHWIAYAARQFDNYDVYRVAVEDDGAVIEVKRLTPGEPTFHESPSWAPDSSKIAFSTGDGSPPVDGTISTMNPDGTGIVPVGSGQRPAWSPDGGKFAFDSFEGGDLEIWTMNTDGSGRTQLTDNAARDFDPDWQPVRPTGYARPRNASPNNIRLVPAFEQCSSGNASHGAPLAVASCSPPQPSSDHLTVGTPDVNGEAANSVGLLTTRVLTEAPIDLTNGDQSDVTVSGQITDVRDRQTLADYAGELRAAFGLRLTDRLNGMGAVHPATALDASFGFSFGCTPTPSGSVGSTCSIATSADAVAPGITPEFKRAVWQLGQVEIYDGGADGDGDTTGDNTLFMTQGLFVP
jgi:hypothetical protein